MSIVDKTPSSQTERIEMEVELAHATAKVWRALTEPELLTAWLLPVFGLSLEPGAAFTFQAPPQPEWDGKVRCKLLSAEPMKRISWSWVVGDMDTVVTFTLQALDTGTRLTLLHTGFAEHQKKNFGGARYGWKMMGGQLVELLGRTS